MKLLLLCDKLLTCHVAVVAGGLGQHITTLVATPERIIIFIKVGQIARILLHRSLDIVLSRHVLYLDNVGHSGESINFGSLYLNLPNPMVHQYML